MIWRFDAGNAGESGAQFLFIFVSRGGTLNVYRDGEYLVAPIKNAEFPGRCVITNAEMEPNYEYMENITRDTAARMAQRAARLGSGAVAVAAAISAIKRVTLKIALSDSIASQYARTKKKIIRTIIGGAVLTFMTAAADFLIESPGMTPLKIAGLIACWIGLLLIIGGTIALVVYVRQPLKLVQTDGTHVWLSGAGSEFLETLPAWEAPATQTST